MASESYSASNAVDGLHLEILRDGKTVQVPMNELPTFQFEDGDEISLLPESEASKWPLTEFGARHVYVDGQAYRIPRRYIIAEYKGFSLLEDLVELTGGGMGNFAQIAQMHLSIYHTYLGLRPDMTVLEVGSGIGRDAFEFIDYLNSDGRYIGVDITRDSIEWCRRNITSRHPNFEFHHFDSKHEMYNPLGKCSSLDFVLPAEDNSVDRIFLTSVFTHLFEEEITHYLKEFARVLKPDGLVYASFFLYEPVAVAHAAKQPTGLKFRHPYSDGFFIDSPEIETAAVAITDEAMTRMIGRAGLTNARPYLRGFWSGITDGAHFGQDAAILARATSPSNDVAFGLLPSDFDGELYLRLHPDVKQAGMNPGDHYLIHGRREGRRYR